MRDEVEQLALGKIMEAMEYRLHSVGNGSYHSVGMSWFSRVDISQWFMNVPKCKSSE